MKGLIRIENKIFEGLISLQDAAELYGKSEVTLRHNIRNGKFKEGQDCKKFRSQWIFDVKALDREYKNR